MSRHTPRRASGKATPILTEQEARDLASSIRAKFPTVAEAEASPEWRHAHGQITRRILAGWGQRPTNSGIYTEERARNIGLLYLTAPHLLPDLPPSSPSTGHGSSL